MALRVRHGVIPGIKSELCLREMSLWNRNDQKQEEKYFTCKPPAGPHSAGIFFYTETH